MSDFEKNKKLVFKGVLFDVYQWQQEEFDGTKKTFEKLKRKNSVNIIPVLDDGKILLIDEEQPERGDFITVPGGQINDGEKPKDAARRELREETGYTCKSLELWLTVQPYGNKIDWTVYNYIARGCANAGDQNLDSGEKITLKPVTVDEFFNIAMHDPKFRNTEITLEILRASQKPRKFDEIRKLFKVA